VDIQHLDFTCNNQSEFIKYFVCTLCHICHVCDFPTHSLPLDPLIRNWLYLLTGLKYFNRSAIIPGQKILGGISEIGEGSSPKGTRLKPRPWRPADST